MISDAVPSEDGEVADAQANGDTARDGESMAGSADGRVSANTLVSVGGNKSAMGSTTGSQAGDGPMFRTIGPKVYNTSRFRKPATSYLKPKGGKK